MDEPVYHFGEFALEPRERRLTGGGQPISLTPKVFDMLVLLVERQGRVISKDELMKALWPRGYVEEATLSNQVWQIRRALGDTAKSNRFIETVPKIGYRFAAAVETRFDSTTAPVSDAKPSGVEPAGSPPPRTALEPPPSPTSANEPAPTASRTSDAYVAPRANRLPGRNGLLLLVAGVVLAAILVAIVASRAKTRPIPAGIEAATVRIVALVGFNNLSRNSKDAWLSPALISMLATELGVANSIGVVSDELVRAASTGITPPLAGGYGRETLERLRKRLNADYIVSGDYLVTGTAEDPVVRVDIALQDTRTGTLTASLTDEVTLSTVTMLARRVGGQLRGKLGVPVQGAALLELVANVEPPTTDAARRIGFAIDAMSRYDAARARDELLEVVAEAPAYAPAYLYLARAWSTLGFRQKALAAAEQAAAHAAALTPELRLLIDAEVQSERYDLSDSAKSWTALTALRPTSIDYRLEAIAADLADSNSASAQSVLAELRRLPLAQGDPRVELAAARIAAKQNDVNAEAAFAARAMEESQARDYPGLVAEAELELGTALRRLGEPKPAKRNFSAAIDTYRAIGNPRGEAQARRKLASTLEGQEAREEYQRAIALAQNVGELGVVGGVYRDVCNLLWNAGDRDGAQTAARRGLEISRQTGDLELQAWTLRALASIASDEAATEEAMREFREVTALTERSNDKGGHVWSLAAYADELRQRGEIAEAVGFCTRAKTEAKALSDPQFEVFSTFTCGLLDMDRGESALARAAFESAARLSRNVVDPVDSANAEMEIGQLDLEESHIAEACNRLKHAAQLFAAIEASTGEADSEALLAICADRLGDPILEAKAVDRVRELRRKITARQEIYFVDIALAQLAKEPQQRAAAIAQLREIAADAERRHWITWSLEAKLAAWRLATTAGDETLGATLARDLRSTATSHGLGRILLLMRATKRE